MAVTIPKFDVNRATDILTKAQEHKMYPDPIPDSPETRILEAEKVVQLALQAKKIAEDVGKEKVKHYDAVMEVLAVAQVDGGTSSVPGGAATQEQPPAIPEPEPAPQPQSADGADQVVVVVEGVEATWEWEQVFVHVLDNGNANLIFKDPANQARLDEERIKRQAAPQSEGGGETAAEPQPAAATSSELRTDAPPPPSTPTSGEQRYADESGVVWIIDQDFGENVEAHPEGTNEKTMLPKDFLKQKLEDQPAAPAEEATPSSTESSQPPSSPEPASSSSSTPGPEQPTSGAPSPPSSPEPSQPQPASSPAEPSSGDSEYDELIARVRRDYEQSGLPLPKDVPQPPDMPSDLTAIPEIQARQLHSQFNACAGRARYLLGLERNTRIGCKRLKEQAIRPAMRAAREELGSKATVTELTQHAEENDEKVTLWKEREQIHSDREAAYGDLFAIYEENVTVLSRDHTMRDTEQAGRKT